MRKIGIIYEFALDLDIWQTLNILEQNLKKWISSLTLKSVLFICSNTSAGVLDWKKRTIDESCDQRRLNNEA